MNEQSIADLVDAYLAGPHELQQGVAGMTDEQLDAAPVAGRWSTRQVVCHIADFEPIYADRMKRVLAEQVPTLFGGDPDLFAASLAYDRRDVDEELQLIRVVRQQMGRILRTLTPEGFERTGNHNEAGILTLEQLLRSVTNHLPHHVQFIYEKRKALGL